MRSRIGSESAAKVCALNSIRLVSRSVEFIWALSVGGKPASRGQLPCLLGWLHWWVKDDVQALPPAEPSGSDQQLAEVLIGPHISPDMGDDEHHHLCAVIGTYGAWHRRRYLTFRVRRPNRFLPPKGEVAQSVGGGGNAPRSCGATSWLHLNPAAETGSLPGCAEASRRVAQLNAGAETGSLPAAAD